MITAADIKEMLVDAIIGSGFQAPFTKEMTGRGLAVRLETENSIEYAWLRTALMELPMEELSKIYERNKSHLDPELKIVDVVAYKEAVQSLINYNIEDEEKDFMRRDEDADPREHPYHTISVICGGGVSCFDNVNEALAEYLQEQEEESHE